MGDLKSEVQHFLTGIFQVRATFIFGGKQSESSEIEGCPFRSVFSQKCQLVLFCLLAIDADQTMARQVTKCHLILM